MGDAFGEQFFLPPAAYALAVTTHEVPPMQWLWTDDTAMAISIVDVLERHGHIDQDALATAFADRYAAEPVRGYGGTARDILTRIGSGESWRTVAREVLGGEGSCGNGSAMRVAPVGAWFADNLDEAARQAALSAAPTHAHPEGTAGAIAIAVAAAVAWQMGHGLLATDANEFVRLVLLHTPAGETRSRIEVAASLPSTTTIGAAVKRLGNGSRILCQDTVPLCVWCAAHHLSDFQEAMWTMVSAGGDMDTTCAIVGGIVALYVGLDGIPSSWRMAREPLP